MNKEATENKDTLIFKNAQQLMDHITLNWTDNFVLCSECYSSDILLFKKRPIFLLITVNAPVMKRYKRYQNEFKNKNCDSKQLLSLEEFCKLDDTQIFDKGLINIMNKSDLKIENVKDTLEEFYDILEEKKLNDYERLRPSWDTYFMTLSFLTARRSNCMKRKVGCILTKNNYIIATGYNGTPRHIKNCYEYGCKRCNSNASMGTQLDLCLCLHAEENALLEVGREKSKGATLYCNTCPCSGCTIKIIQCGVKEVVYALEYGHDEMIKGLFKEAGVTIRKYDKVDYNYLFNF
ncbi:Deoxycytidine monophosphate deaminase required for dCTP and dTTP synthesis [Neocallimastix californiae]|jgi:dCMP deaminase|uniref:Deoxycytidylate deaminase n=1 Tax=Neocallimastix californiae TaxID=1754190 RepID=A0A1Y2F5T2_9FUNG|nr:Deoxycytidine monophosphate deaminase required for dCTP and dTTP synthesis [Neocallimastix californiae]|eukprot:ORY78295.1 Deoxycytidine monophosphate deaminase required for dCTP and dTTP synthesis [Neocallimastix californiae]